MIQAVVLALAALGMAGPSELNDQTFEHWKAYIAPEPEELSFLEIPWHESFWSAVLEAREVGKPVLLWAMNGHPLGCT